MLHFFQQAGKVHESSSEMPVPPQIKRKTFISCQAFPVPEAQPTFQSMKSCDEQLKHCAQTLKVEADILARFSQRLSPGYRFNMPIACEHTEEKTHLCLPILLLALPPLVAAIC
eukprot:895203-Pelagomonas_calceolata.AAC.1